MIKDAEKSRFQREHYHVWKNNCRNFCEYLIKEILDPLDQERGEFPIFITNKKMNFSSTILTIINQ